jgi:hypothetical protein
MSKQINLIEFMSVLWDMGFNLSVEGYSDSTELRLEVIDMQDNSSSMNGLEFYINDESELYDILINNFEHHLEDYGYDFK